MKYVITEHKDFAIFSEVTTHSEIGHTLFGAPTSAGFCHFDDLSKTMQCYGQSVSIGIGSRPDDSDFLTSKLTDN